MCGGERRARAALARQMKLLSVITSKTPVSTNTQRDVFESVTPETIMNFAEAVNQEIGLDLQKHLRVRALVVQYLYHGQPQMGPGGIVSNEYFAEEHKHLRLWLFEDEHFVASWDRL